MMTDAGLIPSRQAPAHTVDGEQSPSDLWAAIATSQPIQRTLVTGVRSMVDAPTLTGRPMQLYDAGVTALDGGYARLVADLDRGHEADGHQRALELTAQLGQDGMTILGHTSLDAVAEGPVPVIDAADVTPTIGVRVGEAFRDRRRAERERTLSLLATLATVCDVRLVCGPVTARWLVQHHRSQLPSEFTSRFDAGHDDQPPIDERVDEALVALDPDGSAVEALRQLADEPTETLAQRELVASLPIGEAAVSQRLSDLEGFGLAQRFSVGRENHVELRPAGSALLDALAAERGQQATLDRQFSATRNSDHRPCNPGAREGAEGSAGAPYRTRWLDRSSHAAAAGTATAGGVMTVRAPVPAADDAADRRTRRVSYDPDHDEAVIAVRATSALQYVTSTALSLASPRLLDAALPISRLEALDLAPRILRDARCIGGLSAEAEDDPEELRDTLVEWGKDIASMTTDLHNGDYEDRDAFRSEIMRSAHGLAGTIAHLLDVAGVDLVRELRLPGSPDHDRLAAIATTVTVATAIQSRYGHFATYRQLFERRDEKREAALTPDVDAADPLGSYIGALVIRGPKAHRLGQHIEGRVTASDPHEDAPEIAVRLPVGTPDRTAYAETASRMCAVKTLSPTREAVTLYRALAGSPYAVADAIHWLEGVDWEREIRLDEVRVTLSRLEPARLLPDATPSASKLLGALLRTATPLTKTALAEKADVSPRSVSNNLPALQALDLVRITDAGLRLQLPFATDEERGTEILPDPVATTTSAQALVFDAALDHVDAADAGRLGDPDDPLGTAFCGPRLDTRAIATHLPALRPWIRAAKALCETPDPDPIEVQFGKEPERGQVSLQAATNGGAIADD